MRPGSVAAVVQSRSMHQAPLLRGPLSTVVLLLLVITGIVLLLGHSSQTGTPTVHYSKSQERSNHYSSRSTNASTNRLQSPDLELPASTLRYFPQAKQCPTGWMQQYARLHSDIMQGRLPARHFLSVAVEAGLADRLTGLITQLWHAVLTQRALTTVAYGTLPSFAAVCDAPFVNWTSPAPGVPAEVIEPLKFTYKGERGYDGNKRELPAEFPRSQYQMHYVINMDDRLGVYQSGNLSTLFQPDPVFLLGASNRGRSFALPRNPHYKQQFWEYGIQPQSAFMCGFFFLCAPSAEIERYYAKFWQALQAPGTLKIGIQIRLGDNVFKGADNEQQAEEILQQGAGWFACAVELEKAFAVPGQQVLWFLNSDSKQLRKAAKAKYGSKLITDDELSMTHPDCFQQGTDTCKQAAMDVAFQHSLGAMLTFSMADYHIVTQASGFGRLGAWLSGRWDNIYEISPALGGGCTANRPTPPGESAFTWAGV